jgi:hypothetical protein
MVEEGESSLEDGGEVQPVTSAPAFSLGVSKLPLHQAEIDDLDLITIVLNSSTQAGLSLVPPGEERHEQTVLESDVTPIPQDNEMNGETILDTKFTVHKVAKGKKGFSKYRPLKVGPLTPGKDQKFPSLTPHVEGSPLLKPIKFKRVASAPKRRASIKPARRKRFVKQKFRKYNPILIQSKVKILMTTRSLSSFPIRKSRWVLVQISKGKNPRIKDMRIDFSKKKDQ